MAQSLNYPLTPLKNCVMMLLYLMAQTLQTVTQGEEKRSVLYLPSELLRRCKSEAALEGASLKQFVADALADHLERKASRASK